MSEDIEKESERGKKLHHDTREGMKEDCLGWKRENKSSLEIKS